MKTVTTRSASSLEPDSIMERMDDPALARVAEKIFAGSRLNLADGLTCLKTHDLAGLGSLALSMKRARFRDRVSFVVNLHINYTNICVNRCAFCAFHRTPGSPEAYLLNPEEAVAEIHSSSLKGLREVHLVGGINPDTDLSYYLDLLKALKAAVPGLNLKAFTAVEIDHIARIASLSWSECLCALKEAGLSALPGGGAEVFSQRVRRRLYPSKIPADTWLRIHAAAHRQGIGSNATLLFGHVETPVERIEHLLRLRDQQDETGGFRAFIPLVFHPANTALSYLSRPSQPEILKMIATARLVLDNIPHVKAYWIMLGKRTAQAALHFGADDLEGTVGRERITHQAGATTETGLARKDMEEMITDAGFQPVERDTFHETVAAAGCHSEPCSENGMDAKSYRLTGGKEESGSPVNRSPGFVKTQCRRG